MEQKNGRAGWYDTSGNRQWYRQYSNVPEAETKTEPVVKKRTGLRVTAVVLCVLILIAATAYAFAPHGGDDENDTKLENPFSDLPSTFSDFPGLDDIPGLFDGSGQSKSPEDYEDYREFFENYFVQEAESGSNIERAEGVENYELELHSQADTEKLSLQQLYSQALDSVVGVIAEIDGVSGYSWGSGVIFSEDGYIVTNAHVISGTDKCSVLLSDGSEHEALLVGEDTQSDIAVLKIDASGLKALDFGNSEELSVGDEVAAIGNPLSDNFSGTLTNGIVSAIGRDMDFEGHTMTLIQTNTALNEGNSGGPLFNMYGQVIGITNMKMSASYFNQTTIEGIAFAIPSTTVKDVVEQLMSGGRVTGRPSIGIMCGTIMDSIAEYYDIPSGLYISKVDKGSGAEKAGIQAGDILTAVNGKPVSYVEEVNAIKDGLSVGDTMTMTIFRNGETFDVEAELTETLS